MLYNLVTVLLATYIISIDFVIIFIQAHDWEPPESDYEHDGRYYGNVARSLIQWPQPLRRMMNWKLFQLPMAQYI